MICIFGCDHEEARFFESAAHREGADICLLPGEIDAQGAASVPWGCVVSVSHRAPVNARLLALLQGRGVKYLNTRSIGVDHIDRASAEKAGIAVEGICYSPQSVAEHAVMLMLMAVRNAAPLLRRAQQGDYRLPERRAGTLGGMTIGIVGTGRIGRCVAEMLHGFGCTLLGYDPMPSAAVRYVPLAELLAQSDIVTLHLPLMDATRHLIDRESIAGMKRGAMLVNVARGGLVDSAALADALEEGQLSAAALDVAEDENSYFYRRERRGRSALPGRILAGRPGATPEAPGGAGGLPEPPLAGMPEESSEAAEIASVPLKRLLALPNVVLTPHCAYYTRQALADIVENTLENCSKHERMNENETSANSVRRYGRGA